MWPRGYNFEYGAAFVCSGRTGTDEQPVRGSVPVVDVLERAPRVL